MRVAIREQLCALVVFAILVALMILSIPTWVYVHGFTSDVQSNQLALTASLKSSRISSELELVQTSAITISSRLLLQQSLLDFYAGNTSESNWYVAKRDIESALNVSLLTGLLQARIYSRNITGNPNGLVNVTGTDIGTIRMPYDGPDGNPIFMGDSANGYPPELYPNITYHDLQRNSTRLTSEIAWAAEAFPDVRIAANGGLLLGPLAINDTFALMSISTPIRSRQLDDFVLGYITIVFSADTLLTIRDSREGMGSTGVLLLVGSTNRSNRFGTDNPVSNNTYEPEREKFRDTQVRFLLAPLPLPGQANRHSRRTIDGRDDIPFAVSSYPAVFDSLTRRINTVNNASADLSTHNEQNVPVAVGFARTNTPLVNWTVVVEQAKSETDAPISTLRNIILGCVFGTAGLAILLIFPCAHLSVQPIRRLKYATEKTVAPPGYEDGAFDDYDDETPGSGAISARSQRSKRDGMVAAFYKMIGYKPKEASPSEHDRESARRTFKIPSKVEDRKHFITDELTELTETFNEMSEELVKQYTSLDAKVAERTRELEISKKAAEAANESKTLFIANISHELKTPLNGILGMCAICMEETDVGRIKQSLKTLYKSGKPAVAATLA
jgi:osomolarity two-component system sensor histidine kinase SLN1